VIQTIVMMDLPVDDVASMERWCCRDHWSPEMNDNASAERAIFELVRLERFARDQGDWRRLVDSYWQDATITVTWFKGGPADFAEESRKLYDGEAEVSTRSTRYGRVSTAGGGSWRARDRS